MSRNKVVTIDRGQYASEEQRKIAKLKRELHDTL